jgi:hypothetical protein
MTKLFTPKNVMMPTIPSFPDNPVLQKYLQDSAEILSTAYRKVRGDLDAVDNAIPTITSLTYKQQHTQQQRFGCWFDCVYKDTTHFMIKPKFSNGYEWTGAVLPIPSTGYSEYKELTADYTVDTAATGDGGKLNGITAILASSIWAVIAYKGSDGNLKFGLSWLPKTSFSVANPTTVISTLQQVNSQDIGYAYPVGGRIVVWQDTDEWETPLAWMNAGAVTYDPSKDKPKISSRTATTLTLGASLENNDFLGSNNCSVYQTSGFQPLQISDGAICSYIGSNGWLDTGIRIVTNAAAQIQPFLIVGDVYCFTNGTGAADYAHNTGIETYTGTTGWVVFRTTLCPPDKCGIVIVCDINGRNVLTKSYYNAYGEEWTGALANDSDIVLREESYIQHGLFCFKMPAGGYTTSPLRGYLI